MKQIYLCADCGTTVIKASLVDGDYQVIDEEKVTLTLESPFPSASELDMTEVWRSFCAVTKALAARNGEAMKHLAGVGLTGQGDGMWPLDAEGRPVGNAMLWNDTRSRDIDFDAVPGMRAAFDNCCCNQIYAGSVLALLTWTKRNRPEQFDKIRWAVHCKDWVNYCLTGEIATDDSDASSCAYNHRTGEYAREVYELAGASDCLKRLPRIVPSMSVLGKVSSRAARESGIGEGVPVIEGGIDVAVVTVGNGTFVPGSACAIIGTTLSSQISLKKEDMSFSDKEGLYVHHTPRGVYLRLMPTLSGASTMDYIKGLLFPGEKYPTLEKRMEELPIGCGGLIYHPYICGERAPFKNPFATAGFFGLTQSHTTLHMMRAAMEGLACSFYDCFAQFEGQYNRICLSGGASVSPTVCQMFADMIGRPCERISAREAGIMGVARMMPVALGAREEIDLAGLNDDVTVFKPDMARHEKYLKVYALFKQLQGQMDGFWKARAALL